ncbi:MAG: hypothetical protein JSU86_00600 [Phycisphaerales bacterium]|nr:MAG: hypothetical protein JSU86_00600 [Phycisphaerales bacterium]
MQRVGTSVGQLVEEALGPGADAAREVAVVFADHVDEEFQRHCRTVVRGRTLVINVDAPSLVYPMRMRWLSRLCEILSSSNRQAVDRVVFEFGTAGISVMEFDGQQA